MRVLLSVLMALFPMQALALSCIAPSVARSYLEYDKADDSYVVVQGRLTFDPRLLPKTRHSGDTPPEMTPVPAHLTGKSLNRAGFKVPFEQDVTLEVACFGPWCGGAKDGGEVLAFVRVTDGVYALDINPCGGAVFPEPRTEMLREARDCLRGNCVP